MSSKDTPEKSTPEGSHWDAKTSARFENKAYSEYFDPCQEAASRSLKCLHRNAGKREMCTDYFQAYRDCKQEWITARKEAKREAKLKAGNSWFS